MLRPYKANIVQQLAAQKTCATFRYSKVDGEVDMRDGWRTCKLYEIIERFIDYRGKTPRKTTSGIPLITAKIVKDGFINDPKEFIAEEDYDSWMRRGLPMKGDVVLTTEAPLGEVAQIRTNERVALAQRIITLRGKKDILANAFLKFALQDPIMQHRLHARASGSTVQGIKNSELQKVEIELPPFSIQRRIAEIWERWMTKSTAIAALIRR